MTDAALNRRQLLKTQAAMAAAAVAGLPTSSVAQLITDRKESELVWNKAPCRFCGTGCGVLVATKDGRVVATHGDAKAEVNRGLNCVKGYFLSKIMYGEDRLTQPLLRKKNGKFDKTGEFTPVSQRGAVIAIYGAIYTLAGIVAPLTMGRVIKYAATPLEGYMTGFTINAAILVASGVLGLLLLWPNTERARLTAAAAQPKFA